MAANFSRADAFYPTVTAADHLPYINDKTFVNSLPAVTINPLYTHIKHIQFPTTHTARPCGTEDAVSNHVEREVWEEPGIKKKILSYYSNQSPYPVPQLSTMGTKIGELPQVYSSASAKKSTGHCPMFSSHTVISPSSLTIPTVQQALDESKGTRRARDVSVPLQSIYKANEIAKTQEKKPCIQCPLSQKLDSLKTPTAAIENISESPLLGYRETPAIFSELPRVTAVHYNRQTIPPNQSHNFYPFAHYGINPAATNVIRSGIEDPLGFTYSMLPLPCAFLRLPWPKEKSYIRLMPTNQDAMNSALPSGGPFQNQHVSTSGVLCSSTAEPHFLIVKRMFVERVADSPSVYLLRYIYSPCSWSPSQPNVDPLMNDEGHSDRLFSRSQNLFAASNTVGLGFTTSSVFVSNIKSRHAELSGFNEPDVCVFYFRLRITDLPFKREQLESDWAKRRGQIKSTAIAIVIVFDFRFSELKANTLKTFTSASPQNNWSPDDMRRLVHLTAQTHSILDSWLVNNLEGRELTIIHLPPPSFAALVDSAVLESRSHMPPSISLIPYVPSKTFLSPTSRCSTKVADLSEVEDPSQTPLSEHRKASDNISGLGLNFCGIAMCPEETQYMIQNGEREGQRLPHMEERTEKNYRTQSRKPHEQKRKRSKQNQNEPTNNEIKVKLRKVASSSASEMDSPSSLLSFGVEPPSRLQEMSKSKNSKYRILSTDNYVKPLIPPHPSYLTKTAERVEIDEEPSLPPPLVLKKEKHRLNETSAGAQQPFSVVGDVRLTPRQPSVDGVLEENIRVAHPKINRRVWDNMAVSLRKFIGRSPRSSNSEVDRRDLEPTNWNAASGLLGPLCGACGTWDRTMSSGTEAGDFYTSAEALTLRLSDPRLAKQILLNQDTDEESTGPIIWEAVVKDQKKAEDRSISSESFEENNERLPCKQIKLPSRPKRFTIDLLTQHDKEKLTEKERERKSSTPIHFSVADVVEVLPTEPLNQEVKVVNDTLQTRRNEETSHQVDESGKCSPGDKINNSKIMIQEIERLQLDSYVPVQEEQSMNDDAKDRNPATRLTDRSHCLSETSRTTFSLNSFSPHSYERDRAPFPKNRVNRISSDVDHSCAFDDVELLHAYKSFDHISNAKDHTDQKCQEDTPDICMDHVNQSPSSSMIGGNRSVDNVFQERNSMKSSISSVYGPQRSTWLNPERTSINFLRFSSFNNWFNEGKTLQDLY